MAQSLPGNRVAADHALLEQRAERQRQRRGRRRPAGRRAPGGRAASGQGSSRPTTTSPASASRTTVAVERRAGARQRDQQHGARREAERRRGRRARPRGLVAHARGQQRREREAGREHQRREREQRRGRAGRAEQRLERHDQRARPTASGRSPDSASHSPSIVISRWHGSQDRLAAAGRALARVLGLGARRLRPARERPLRAVPEGGRARSGPSASSSGFRLRRAAPLLGDASWSAGVFVGRRRPGSPRRGERRPPGPGVGRGRVGCACSPALGSCSSLLAVVALPLLAGRRPRRRVAPARGPLAGALALAACLGVLAVAEAARTSEAREAAAGPAPSFLGLVAEDAFGKPGRLPASATSTGCAPRAPASCARPSTGRGSSARPAATTSLLRPLRGRARAARRLQRAPDPLQPSAVPLERARRAAAGAGPIRPAARPTWAGSAPCSPAATARGGSFWREHPQLPRLPGSLLAGLERAEPARVLARGPGRGRVRARCCAPPGAAIKRVDPGAEIVTAGLPDSELGVPLRDYLGGDVRGGRRGHLRRAGGQPLRRDAPRACSTPSRPRAGWLAHERRRPAGLGHRARLGHRRAAQRLPRRASARQAALLEQNRCWPWRGGGDGLRAARRRLLQLARLDSLTRAGVTSSACTPGSCASTDRPSLHFSAYKKVGENARVAARLRRIPPQTPVWTRSCPSPFAPCSLQPSFSRCALPAAASAAPPPGFVGMTRRRPLRQRRAVPRQGTRRSSRRRACSSCGSTFNWAAIEIAPNNFDFTNYDRYVLDAARHSITILPVLFNAPDFYSSEARGRGCLPAARQRRHGALGGAARATATDRTARSGRVNPGVTRSPITAWQIWNEPNLKQYWYPQAERAAVPGACSGPSGRRIKSRGPERRDRDRRAA